MKEGKREKKSTERNGQTCRRIESRIDLPINTWMREAAEENSQLKQIAPSGHNISNRNRKTNYD